MKAIKTLLLLLALGLSVHGQGIKVTANKIAGGSAAPPSSCSAQSVYLQPDGDFYVCASGTYSPVSGGGGTPGGSDTQLQYNNAGAFGGISGATSDGTSITFGSGNLLATAPVFTTSTTVTRNSVGVTSADGIILQNTTAAAAGAQQYSPRLRLTGQGWKTTATAASQSVDWVVENQPVQGSTNPTSNLALNFSVNGGAYAQKFSFTSGSRINGDNATPYLELSSGSGTTLAYSSNTVFVGGSGVVANVSSNAAGFFSTAGLNLAPTGCLSVAASGTATAAADSYICRQGAANFRFGQAAAASPVAQTISFQGGTGTNTAGGSATIIGPLGTSQGAPGIINLKAGAMIAASGTTAQTDVSRLAVGVTQVVPNNSATTVATATLASNTAISGVFDYSVEVFDGTDVQVEVGAFSYMATNKAGAFSGNTTSKFGNQQNMSAGTLTVTWAISGANPALISVNANSSLTPSTGYPRITLTPRNLGQQAITFP